MFRQSSATEYEEKSEGGTRYLFALDHFQFFDALDDEGELRHFVLEQADGEREPEIYETNRQTMYEFMARFLAGEFEKAEYELDHSPAHAALLDALEIATTGARSGETEFSLEELDFEADEDDDEEEYQEEYEEEADDEPLADR